jgi:hypothetical protein
VLEQKIDSEIIIRKLERSKSRANFVVFEVQEGPSITYGFSALKMHEQNEWLRIWMEVRNAKIYAPDMPMKGAA